jgi:hypothetical protein
VSAVLSSGRIAEHALRQIGAYSTNDLGADAAQFEVALERLDILVAELASTEAVPWLVQTSARQDLVSGTRDYVLTGLEHVTAAWIDRDGTLDDIELLRLGPFEELEGSASDPRAASVLRTMSTAGPALTLRVWPTPATAQVGAELVVTGQSYPANLFTNHGRDGYGLPTGWARYLIYLLAADIGAGPVHMLTPGVIQGFEQRAVALKARLTAHSSRDQLARPRFTRYRDF